ncbi:hypothetical protein EV649_0323 [Kribbella sp. VKM Ac-2569]|nr:hypothetical protein EV649_0323 [Kribbella sp. VKM Ac-2569]
MRFTLRRDPCGRLSACADGPSGRDVDGCVHVGIGLVSAGCAPENRLALAVLRCAMPAGAAGLRGVRGVDSLDPSGSFVLEASHQSSPAIGTNAAVESRLGAAPIREIDSRSRRIRLWLRSPGHLGKAKVFDSNDVEAPREIAAGLLDPVLAAIGAASAQLGNRRLRSLSSAGPAVTASQSALQAFKPSLLGDRQSRTPQQFASAQRRGHRDAAVHADNLARTGWRDRGGDDSEGDVPATRAVAGDAVRLRVGYGARQPESYPASLGYQCLRPFPAHLHDPGRLGADDPESFVEVSLAPLRSPMDPGVEVLDSLVEIPQRLLLHGLRPCAQPARRGSSFGQLPTLFGKARCSRFVGGPHRPLLERQIPHVARMLTVLQQRNLLCGGRVEPEPGHGTHRISRRRHFPVTEGRKPRFLRALSNGRQSRQYQ